MSDQSGFSETELRKFSEAGRTIAAAVGTSVELWARSEAGVILKTWAGRTKVTTQAKADRRSALHSIKNLSLTNTTTPGDITVNAGIRGTFGRVWVRSSSNRRGTGRPYRLAGTMSRTSFAFRPERYHWKTGTWTDIREAVADVAYQLGKAIPAGRKSIGLARQSVVQIADALGIRLESVKGGGALSAAGLAKARSAIASNGQRYRNGTGTQGGTAGQFFVELVNRYPKLRVMGMDSTLAGVIRGRLGYFRRNLEEGTFLSAQRAARAYPYLYVLKSAA